MALFDLPLEQLRTYAPPISEPADFDAFWRRTCADADVGLTPLEAKFERVDDPIYRLVDVHDVTYRGFGGQPIRGWFLEPAGNMRRLPCIVSYVGYGGGRSLPVDHVAAAVAGFAHFVMDTRGQGAVWSPGDTADDAGAGPAVPGFLTRGISSAETYYYRRVFVDAVRAVQAAAAHPRVDADRIAVSGASQGGGIAIAAAALAAERVKLLIADVPFLCHFRRAVTITDQAPYSELAAYLRIHRAQAEAVFATLAYFDAANFAARVRATTLMSVGMMDMLCPPSTVFAAYNRMTAPKDIRVYEFNGHEGGGVLQAVERLRFVARHFA